VLVLLVCAQDQEVLSVRSVLRRGRKLPWQSKLLEERRIETLWKSWLRIEGPFFLHCSDTIGHG
jgi:hypothetical protein